MTCGTTPAPASQATNPVPLPIRDPIATLPEEDDDDVAPPTPLPPALDPSPRKKGKKAKGDSNAERVKKAVGKPHKNRPGKKREKHTTVTQPWIRWFSYINNQLIGLLAGASKSLPTGDPWRFDFSSEDFWSNVGGPGTGSWDVIVAQDDHPGIQRLRTDVNNGDITTAFFPTAALGAPVRWDQVDFARFVFKTPPTITSCRFEVGLSSDPRSNWAATTFEFGSDMIYLLYDTSTDNALRFKLRVGGALATSFVIVDPCPADTWVDVTFQRRRTGATYVLDVLVNGQVETTVSTGLPSDATAYGGTFKIGTRTAAARDLLVDFADIRPVTIGTRWSVAL